MQANNQRQHTPSSLFLVRVWPEVADRTEGETRREWHGIVQKVLSGEAEVFCDWSSLVDSIIAMLPDAAGRQGEGVSPSNGTASSDV